jgi:glycosyltransferase involved in cell wall biosynthesis
MKLSLCITTFNRTTMVIEAFEKVYDHPLIDEIVICDDCSTDENYTQLLELWYLHPAKDKIKIFRNEKNLNMSRNKAKAISHAKNDWVAIIDSDNILPVEYFDSLTEFWYMNKHLILHPDFAEPEHDYRQWDEEIITSINAKDFLHEREFRCLLNSCNYIVNRDEYLRVYKYDPSIKESDTIYFNTLWLESGNGFYVVPGMKYHHRKHSGSGWLNGDHKYNMNKAAELQEKIKNL